MRIETIGIFWTLKWQEKMLRSEKEKIIQRIQI